MYNFLIGVDIGKQQDYTAISLVKRQTQFREKAALPGTDAWERERSRVVSRYDLQHLERVPLGTSYPQVVRRVQSIMENPKVAGQAFLLVDITGVGRPVVDMMVENGLSPIGITITGGNGTSQTRDGFHVPRIEIITALQIMFQAQILKYADPSKLRNKEIRDTYLAFLKELKSVNPRTTPRSADTWETWRDQEHDDLVFSVGMVCWYVRKVFATEVKIGKPTGAPKQSDILRRGLRGSGRS